MKRKRFENGAALIELAIVMPALLLVFAGIAESGLLFRTFEVTTNAAREGARLGALPGTEADNYAIVRTRVEAYLADAGLTATHTVNVTPETMAIGSLTAAGTRVTVTYTYNTAFLGSVMGLFNGTFTNTIDLHSTALMRVQVAAVGP